MTKQLLENSIKSPIKTVIYGILLSTSGMFFGFGAGFFNTFFEPFIENIYSIYDEKKKVEISGNLMFFFILGGFFSCLTAGSICEKIGRFKSLVGLTLLGILATFGYFFKGLYFLYFFRFVNGWISCCWTFVAPLVLKENVCERFKGALGLGFYVFLTFGILVSYSFDSVYFAIRWRYVFGIPLLFEIPKLFCYFFIFKMESPVWLCNKFNEDKKLLKEKLTKNYLYLYNKKNSEKMSTHIILERKKLQGKQKTIKFLQLFTKPYQKQFLMGIFLNFLNTMTGINFLIFYSTKIFQTLNLPCPSLLTFFLGFLNLLGAILISTTSKTLKKKHIIASGLFLQSFSYFTFLTGYITNSAILLVSGTYLFTFSFSVSLGASLYPYLAEILPPVGISCAAGVQWVIALFIGKYAIVVIQWVGVFRVFFAFMGISFFGGVVVAGFGVVTEGKRDFEVQSGFMEKEFMV